MKPYRGRRKEQIRRSLTGVAIISVIIVTMLIINTMDAKHAEEAKEWTSPKPTATAEIITPAPTLEPTPEPTPTPRLTLTADETDLIARIVWHEARGESAEGQRAVVEVIFNRVEADNFPDTVEDVIFQKNQFSSAEYIDIAEPTTEQFEAINEALYEEPMLPSDVVYFSRSAENDRVWGVIGGHTFCRQYEW